MEHGNRDLPYKWKIFSLKEEYLFMMTFYSRPIFIYYMNVPVSVEGGDECILRPVLQQIQCHAQTLNRT
jgi:hypothetical protein